MAVSHDGIVRQIGLRCKRLPEKRVITNLLIRSEHDMKHILPLLSVELITIASPVHAQKEVYGPHVIDDGRIIRIDGICSPFVQPVGAPYTPWIWKLFRAYDSPGYDKEYRFIADWHIPNDSTMYPRDAKRARLRIEYYGVNLPNLTADVWSFSSLSSTMDDATVINGMTGSADFTITGANGLVEYSATSGTFLNIVNGGADIGHLTEVCLNVI